MNKKKLILILTTLVLAVSAAIILMFAFIERPAFSGIEKDEISSVSYFIYYFEDDEPVYLPLPEENYDELLELMDAIKIKGFNDPEAENYTGGTGFMFIIYMKDGTKIEFSSTNPHMKINGRYYRTEYKPANDLYEFWRGFVNSGRKAYGVPEL